MVLHGAKRCYGTKLQLQTFCYLRTVQRSLTPFKDPCWQFWLKQGIITTLFFRCHVQKSTPSASAFSALLCEICELFSNRIFSGPTANLNVKNNVKLGLVFNNKQSSPLLLYSLFIKKTFWQGKRCFSVYYQQGFFKFVIYKSHIS